MRQMSDKTFDPSLAFFDLPIVRNTFGLACLVVVVSFALITIFTESKATFDKDGFNGFIEMFKFPLGSIAFFGGLFAFYATNHRSEQQKRAMELTQKSIEMTGEQNRFANYYKHLEEFVEYSSDNLDSVYTNHLKIDYRRLHYVLYPNGKLGKILLGDNSQFLKSYFEYILNFTNCLIKYQKSAKTDDDLFGLIGALDRYLDNYVDLLNGAVSIIKDEYIKLNFGGETILMPQGGILSMIERSCASIAIEVFNIAIKFEPESERFNLLNSLCLILDSMGKEYFEFLPDSTSQSFSKSQDLQSLDFLNKISVPSPPSKLFSLRLGLLKRDLNDAIYDL